MSPSEIRSADWLDRLRSVAWRDLALVGLPVVVVLLVAVWVAGKAIHFAPPGTIRILSGPDGSGYRATADKYKKIIERYGVKVEVCRRAARSTIWRSCPRRRSRWTSGSCRAASPTAPTPRA